MFSFRRPTPAIIQDNLQAARLLPVSYEVTFDTKRRPDETYLPQGFARDHTRSEIGRGHAAFETARAAFRQWKHFDLGWVQVANPDAKIEQTEIVAIQAHTLGLWSVNFSRVLYVIDEPHRFGYAYGTTALHVERGEERFLVEHDPASGAVYYDLLALSQPAHWMAWLAYPYTRSRQRKFARESHRRMRLLAAESLR